MTAGYKTLAIGTIFAAATFTATLPAGAQNNTEVMMSDDPTYCEVYSALSNNVSEECADASKPKTRGLTLTGTTQGLSINSGSSSGGAAPLAATTQASGTVAGSGPKSATFSSIQFEFNSVTLTARARSTLDTVAKVLNDPDMQSQSFIIEGHTDSVGSAAYNQTLSEDRARAVANYLKTQHGVESYRLRWRGRGESQPYNPSDPAAGVNRRVVILSDQG